MSPERQTPVPIEEEMRKSYLDYAMSVIVGRALPDIRDGLKPVHRRVLYTMNMIGVAWNRPYKKSARIVGDCMGKYHPHGDAPIYETLVRMVQEFSLRYPLVDGQGNFGSIDGDPAAAMRYTEARMARIAHEMLADIDKDTVDFAPNYDDNETEPIVLPTRIPNLLVNGSAGIAVGMATNIPPHNLTEVVNGLVMLIERPDTTVEQLAKVITGPDFPTARYDHAAGEGSCREAARRPRGHHHHRAALPGEQGEPHREDLGAQPRKEDRGDLGNSGRVQPRGHPGGDGAGPGGDSPDPPQPALQAHPDADDVRNHHAGAGRPAAPGGQPQGDARGLHQGPPGGGHAAHAL